MPEKATTFFVIITSADSGFFNRKEYQDETQ